MSWLPTVAVELVLSAWIVLMLAFDVAFKASRQQQLWKVAFIGVLVAFGALLWQQPWIGTASDPMFVLDPFAWIFKGLFLLTALVVILITRVFAKTQTANVGSFYLLILTALLGTTVLASINDLLLLFVGLELLTFSLYVMAAYLRSDSRSVEAGMKYLIVGSISSGFLIYGISLLYGMAGGTNFGVLREAFASGQLPPLAAAGLVMVLAGLGFKLAAVPFQLWAPDVYEGAPVPVVALLSVGSKMAGAVAILRLLYGVFLPAQTLWGDLLAVASALTIIYGNFAALPQTNIKRLLGYSSIGHAGYLLMGLSTATTAGVAGVEFYLLAYLVSNLTAFLVVAVVSQALGDRLDDYNGLARRSPILAAGMFLALLSLAGVPPLAGFVGKLLVLLAAVDDHKLWLVSIGGLNVAVSLYYYLMVVRRMYAVAPSSTSPLRIDGLTRLLLIILMVSIILIGVVQEPFLQHLSSAILP